MERREELRRAIPRVSSVLRSRGIWHVLHYGTLLGIHRDGDVIEWDHDIDFLARAGDRAAVLAANADTPATGVRFQPMRMPGSRLAVNPGRVTHFDPGVITVIVDERTVGDVFLPTLFADGMLRLHDLETATSWWPHSAVPYAFVAERTDIEWRGHRLPVPVDPERVLRCLYGDDWQTPYRSVRDGGDAEEGRTYSGESAAPGFAQRRSSDAAVHVGQPAWPRPLRGAGPRGDHPRAVATSGSEWWHDLAEVSAY